MPQLSIALYERGLDGSYHWALILSEDNPSGLVNVYQITDTVKDRPNSQGPWRLDNRVEIDLTWSSRFIGCILLPTSKDVTIEIMHDFISQYEAAKSEDYYTENNVPWSCARWIIRALEDLVAADMVNMEMTGFYRRVLARGMQLKNGQGDKSSSVQTIEL